MADASGPGHSYDGSHDVNTILSLVSSCVSWAWQLVNTIKFLRWAPELGESFACCNMLKYDEICETMLKHNAKKNMNHQKFTLVSYQNTQDGASIPFGPLTTFNP